MNSLASLATYFTSRMRCAWQRHCEIIQLTYELNGSSDRAVNEGISRGDVPEAAKGRFLRA